MDDTVYLSLDSVAALVCIIRDHKHAKGKQTGTTCRWSREWAVKHRMTMRIT